MRCAACDSVVDGRAAVSDAWVEMHEVLLVARGRMGARRGTHRGMHAPQGDRWTHSCQNMRVELVADGGTGGPML